MKADKTIVFLLAISSGLNVFLAFKVRTLEAAIARADELERGTLLGELSLRDEAGRYFQRNFTNSSKPTILYVLSPNCVWCERNAPNVKALMRCCETTYDILGISLVAWSSRDRTEQKLGGLHILGIPSTGDVSRFKLGTTPEMIVLNRNGRVEHVWIGAFDESRVSEIEHALSIPKGILKAVH